MFSLSIKESLLNKSLMLFLIIRWLVLEVWTTCRWLQNTCTKRKRKLNSWAVGQSNPFIMSEIKEQKNPTEMCWNKPGPLVSYGIPYKSKCRRIENYSLKQIPGFCCEQPYSKSFIVIIYSRFFFAKCDIFWDFSFYLSWGAIKGSDFHLVQMPPSEETSVIVANPKLC